MRLSEICVNRPVFAFMLIMFLVVMGVFSFMGLGVDLFPQSDPAQIYVRLRLPGASPEEMVSQVVLPVEEAVAAVSGIEELRAMVTEGSANVMITFVLERDIGEAVEDVREKVSGAMRRLPPNILPPVVLKAELDREPVVTLAVSGQRPIRELTEIADKQIRRALETVDGVAGIDVSGSRPRQINVFMDLNKLNGYGLTAQDVETAVRTENVEMPGGRIVRGTSEMGVRTMGRVESVADFNKIIIKTVGGAPVRLRDIGYVEDGMAEKRNFAFMREVPAVSMEVQRQTGMNTVAVVEGVIAKLDTLKLPAGVKVEVIKETATYIRNSVSALEEHLLLGSLLASIIVWIFIRDWRTVLISSLAIPTSIVTTFTLLRVLNFTLNSMTLLALTLAVGIVIDDAIIVLENIYRFLEEKALPPMQAAVLATKEIALAVMATTLSLVIIFVPIAFMTGYAKRFLNQFGWTMSVSIMVSMLVAFTLTPALSARLLKRKGGGKSGEPAEKHGHKQGWMERIYGGVLSWSLDHRWVIVCVSLLTLGSTYFINQHVGRDWMPQEDQSELGIFVELPEGSSIEATEKIARDMTKKIEAIPGVTMVFPRSAAFMERVTMAFLTIILEPEEKRASITEMAQKVRVALQDYAYLRPRINFPNLLGGRDSFSPIRGMLLGPDMKVLVNYAKQYMIEIGKEPAVADVKANLNLNNPELQITVDRQLASDLGVRVANIAGAVRLLMSGEDQISTFKEDAEQYPVMMRLTPEQRDDPAVLSRLLVPSAKLGLIRLDSIAKLERGLGPSRVDRFARQFAVSVYGNVGNGYGLGDAALAASSAVDKLELPPGYKMVFSGQVKVLEETTTNMLMGIGLASIFMYMVLAAQFESLVHPFIILLTLPLSIPFAVLSLLATGRTLNLFSAL
ncbi:MAG: efflux RND transporter permease subunit, partial [Bryobacteraceae bacterium]